MTRSPRKSVDDTELGTLNYYIDSLEANIAFDAPPIASAHIQICEDENGPTKQQLELLRLLPLRHRNLWSDICTSLIRCNAEIQTIDELCARLITHLSVSIYHKSNTVELGYRIEGEPEFRGYFVALRDWKITEVCTAE